MTYWQGRHSYRDVSSPRWRLEFPGRRADGGLGDPLDKLKICGAENGLASWVLTQVAHIRHSWIRSVQMILWELAVRIVVA